MESNVKKMLKEVLVDIRSRKITKKEGTEKVYKHLQEISSTDIKATISGFRDFLKEKKLIFEELSSLEVKVFRSQEYYENFIKKNRKKTCHVFYINNDFKNSKWKKNQFLFYRIIQSYKDDPQHCFAVVDCSIQYVQNTNIRIEVYVSGKLNCADYWKEEGENLEKSLVKFNEKPTKEKRPEKGDPVRLSCPHCKDVVIEWTCSECKDVLFYNREQKLIFCPCGVHKLSKVYFRCSGEKHGVRYFLYEEEQLYRDMDGMKPDSEINILIIGETGVGKSTWINAFANYLTYDTFDAAEEEGPITLIPSKFVSEGREIKIGKQDNLEDLCVGQSGTQFPVTHSFYIGNGRVIRIIDTPGINDVRGLEQDKQNFENILSHLSYYDEIHAICILLKSNQSRLTVSFRFCLSQLLVHLHVSAAANVIFCFTHSRETFYKAGNTIPILQEYLSKQTVKIPITPQNQYYFDSESFRCLAIIKNGVEMNEAERKIYAASWDKGCIESSRLMEWIHKLVPHDTRETISVNEARRIIICMMKPLAKISQNIKRNLQFASDKKSEIEVAEREKKELQKKLNFTGMSIKMNPLPYPRTVCAHSDCVAYASETKPSGLVIKKTNYVTQCHEHCHLKNIPVGNKGEKGLRHCKALKKNPHACHRCKHSYLEHQHINYELEEEQKEFINIEVKKKIESKQDKQDKVKIFIKSLDKLVKELKCEENVIINTCAEFACYLQKNAITTFNDAMEDHIKMLIEESKNQGRDRKEIENQEEVLQRYIEERNAIQGFMSKSQDVNRESIKQPADIKNKLNKLFSLQHNGSEVKDIFDKIEQIRRIEARFLQRPYSAQKMNRGGPKPTSLAKRLMCLPNPMKRKIRNFCNMLSN